ncbi:MAG: purine-nucleoside phosphorylase [Saprospiraceae bacterium]
MHVLEAIEESVRFIKARINTVPKLGIVLGTGLSGFAEELTEKQEIPYRVIPHFVQSTVAGHAGKLVFGHLDGMPTVMMAGRFHYYEGYSLPEVTFPIRVMKHLGVERMIITNVSGSLQPEFKAGDILLVTDHINLLPSNPLRGINDERLGPRFPDLTNTYDLGMIAKARTIANNNKIPVREGVYVAVPGPSLETKAERIFLQKIGADAVGMSTVPEVIVCKHMSLPVNVFSIISNEFNVETSVEEVIEVAAQSESKLRTLIKELLREI